MNLGRHKQQPEGAVQHYFFVLIHFWQRRRLHDPFPFNLLVANPMLHTLYFRIISGLRLAGSREAKSRRDRLGFLEEAMGCDACGQRW
jgi:hypothetical protein